MTVRAVVFDAYGTLYDVQSVGRLATELCGDKGELITQLWRLKQLEYTWLRGLMQTYEDFSVVTRDLLDFALERVGVRSTATIRDSLMAKYLKLDLYPETLRALEALADYRLAILSNGSPAMLELVGRGIRRRLAVLRSDQRRPGEDLQARPEMLRTRRKIARGSWRRSALRLFKRFRCRRSQAIRLPCRLGRAWRGRSAAGELRCRADRTIRPSARRRREAGTWRGCARRGADRFAKGIDRFGRVSGDTNARVPHAGTRVARVSALLLEVSARFALAPRTRPPRRHGDRVFTAREN